MSKNRGSVFEWQMGKSVVECNQYMFEHEIATDVIFEVGHPDGTVGTVRAHKYMLISRSAVFEAMFCSGLAETHASSDTKIPITDVDVGIFREMLRFIYCELADVSSDTALALLYAAKKYLILDLVEQCRKFLQDNLTSESVSSILDLGLAFDEPDLISRCLGFISEHAFEVFSTEGFLNMTHSALEAVVKLDVLSATEQLMYDSCMAWARHNCLPDSSPSDGQIREVLGSLVYGIRFPSMDPAEFTRLVMRSDVLSPDEKLAVYYFYHTRDIDSNSSGNSSSFKLPFNSQPRKPHETVVSRFSNVSASEWPTAGKTDTIDFTADHDVVLIGVGLYGSTPGTVHEVAIEVWMGKILLCIAAKKFETPLCAEPVKIYLGQRVKIRANVTNTIVTTIKGPSTRYGVGGRSRIVSGSTIFTFTASSKCGGRTAVEVGQIPQLFFHTMLTDMALGFSKECSSTEGSFGADLLFFPAKKN